MRPKNVALCMHPEKVIGHRHLKAYFTTTIGSGRVPHAQLFVGSAGSGTLPMALTYARQLLSHTHPAGSPEREQAAGEVDRLVHPDLHFVYPVNKTATVRKHPVSRMFLDEWREFVQTNPYASLFEWLQKLGIENKQGIIAVDEAAEISKALSLKPYKASHKVVIVWKADKMNVPCANKILKLVEEPPDRSVLILITEHEEQIISTIHSRCQKLHFPSLPEAEISAHLQKYEAVDQNMADKIAHRSNGDFNKALHLLSNDARDQVFEQWFVEWVRMAFKARRNKSVVIDLLKWSEDVASKGRETQKAFMDYCIEIFRQALLDNYGLDELVYFEAPNTGFQIQKFAPFIHQNNIYDILAALQDAAYHIERNGNAKVIFSDLSIQLTRLIHRKELV